MQAIFSSGVVPKGQGIADRRAEDLNKRDGSRRREPEDDLERDNGLTENAERKIVKKIERGPKAKQVRKVHCRLQKITGIMIILGSSDSVVPTRSKLNGNRKETSSYTAMLHKSVPLRTVPIVPLRAATGRAIST